jgi:serine/threonine protein kinase
MSLNTGQILNNRYRIVKLLGQGGFGAVYRAWDINLSRPCAVKENMDASPEAQVQFGREATILANLIHPNLVRVTDYFFLPGQGQYLVMDYVEGEDLQGMLERTGTQLNDAQALDWTGQVCDALNYLHSQNPPIIHRDIKPANIKITPEGKAILVDFGIAKIYDPNLKTTLGARAVTSGYSSPEQYGQGKTDPRSDIYSLGATLYTLLTGQAPPDSVDLLMRNTGPVTPAAQINPRIGDQRRHRQSHGHRPQSAFHQQPGFQIGPGRSATHSGTAGSSGLFASAAISIARQVIGSSASLAARPRRAGRSSPSAP